MELSWFENFLSLARVESFSRAAREQNITQPAFSRRIRALEDWLGVVLVDRDTHRIALTPAGTRFVEIADMTLRGLEQGRREIRELAGATQSTLRFAATHALSLTFFPRWIQSVQTPTEQEVSVQLIADNMQAAEKTILDGRVQFLLCHHHAAVVAPLDQRHFAFVTLGHDRLVPVSRRLAGGAGGEAVPAHRLPGSPERPQPLLDYGPESGLGRIMAADRQAAEPRACLHTVFTSHAVMVLAAMTREGQGLAWLPESVIGPDLDSAALCRAGDDSWDVEVEIRLYRPRARQSPTAEAFWTRVLPHGAKPLSGMER